MQVSEIMTRDVHLATPDQTIRDAARMMADRDFGIVPVGDGDRLVGMLSDRDIAIRAIGEGKGPETPVGEVMTADIRYCFDDEDADSVARNMGDEQIRRIPVVNRDKRLVGILSLGDLALEDGREGGETLANVSRPGGPHSQTGGPRS